MLKQIHAKKGRNTRYRDPVLTWNDDIGKRLLTDLHWGGGWGEDRKGNSTPEKKKQLKRGATSSEFRQHAANLLSTLR